ncbi:hypothetical protein [Deinococcus yavapaiensis]|uniref:hypothetical protein n=1 Tax=Deinococcus yavapaiensis TaxID=309889 RepID=UPI0011B3BF03|nr:hypothetical protein [Deinococcus yavapaiensis]
MIRFVWFGPVRYRTVMNVLPIRGLECTIRAFTPNATTLKGTLRGSRFEDKTDVDPSKWTDIGTCMATLVTDSSL